MIDLTGQKYGRLTVKKFSHTSSRKSYWVCKCECGKEKTIRADSLKCGAISSCGCLKKEQNKINLCTRTHNDTNTRLYRIWNHIKRRCYDKTMNNYHNYGQRGIRVCEEWISNYISFKEWALKNGYSDDLSIDRINNDLDYEPSNCIWSNRKEQCINRRTSIRIIVGDRVFKTLVEFCETFNLDYNRTKRRYQSGDRTFERLTRDKSIRLTKKIPR